MGWSFTHTWYDQTWLAVRNGNAECSEQSVGGLLLWLVHGRTVIMTAPSAEPVVNGQAFLRSVRRADGRSDYLPLVRLGPWGDAAPSTVRQYATIGHLYTSPLRSMMDSARWELANGVYKANALTYFLRGRFLPINYQHTHGYENIYLSRIGASDMLDVSSLAVRLT